MAQQKEIVPFIENYIIIWVDSKFHSKNRSDDHIQNSITTLHHIANSIEIFDTCEACIDFIDNKVKHGKIFLIVSGSLGKHLIPQIEHNIKLDSIYIFCRNKLKYEQWVKEQQHDKIIGIYTDIEDIYNQLKIDIKQCEHELMNIQTLDSETSEISNHLDASFMYSQLLKEILLSMEFDNTRFEKAKKDFVDFCRIYYAKDDAELSTIEEFNQNYSNPSPIWWYTRECFLYLMLNRALCTQDVEILIKMSFFISDLHRQLEQLHKTANHQEILTVYRGQGMIYSAFNRMKQHQGGLISFNNFLSTSTSKEVALNFARNALKKPGKIVVLFEMNINPLISTVPFASLDQFSSFEEKEKEILFSMHTVFRINKIKLLNDDDNKSQLWHVQLTSTNADDEQLRQLKEHLRLELCSFVSSGIEINMDPKWRLSKLLVYMGEYDKALALYEMMIDNATRDNNWKLVQAAHYQMAEIFMLYKNDWNKVKEHFKELFSMRIQNGHIVIDEVRNDLFDIFSTMKNLFLSDEIDEDEFHSTISELLSKLVSLYLNYSAKPFGPLGYLLVADRYNYIGWVRRKQGNLSESWDNHQKALEILHKHLPSTHPRLARTYNHIGVLYSMMNDHLNALDCFKKALNIQEKALQPYHSHLAETHFHLSTAFEHLDKIDDAFYHAKEAIDIGRHAFTSSNDPNMTKYQEHFDKILSLNQSSDELVL